MLHGFLVNTMEIKEASRNIRTVSMPILNRFPEESTGEFTKRYWRCRLSCLCAEGQIDSLYTSSVTNSGDDITRTIFVNSLYLPPSIDLAMICETRAWICRPSTQETTRYSRSTFPTQRLDKLCRYQVQQVNISYTKVKEVNQRYQVQQVHISYTKVK